MKVFEKKCSPSEFKVEVLGDSVDVSIENHYHDIELFEILTYEEWDNLVAAVAKAREETK